MAMNLREIIKKAGITQQELADFLGITRQYLSHYLDETVDEPKLPKKYMDNILFLFECRTREDLFAGNFKTNARRIRKRIMRTKQAKDSIDRLFNMDNEGKFEIFQVLESLHALIHLDTRLLEALSLFLEQMTTNSPYRAMLSYLAKRYLIIDFDDEDYSDPKLKAREALLFKAFEDEELNFLDYEALYAEFEEATKKQHNIDVEALKHSLNDLGYTNVSQKDLIEIIKKYNELKKNREVISLKKVAVVIDFHTKSLEPNDRVDLYSIDRFQNDVTTVQKNGRFLEDVDNLPIQDFIHALQKEYEEVFYLLLTHDTINVNDFQWKEALNRQRAEDEGKIYMYPIHYIRQKKEDVARFVLEMYAAGHRARDILARIDRIVPESIFSLHHFINQLILNI